MHVVHHFPHVVGHVLERLVAQDPGIADADVESTEVVDGGLNHAPGVILVRHRTVVRDGLAAGIANLPDHAVGHRRAGAGAVPGTPQIVDDHCGALRSQQQCVGATQPTPGAGHERDFAVQHPHENLPFSQANRTVYCAVAQRQGGRWRNGGHGGPGSTQLAAVAREAHPWGGVRMGRSAWLGRRRRRRTANAKARPSDAAGDGYGRCGTFR